MILLMGLISGISFKFSRTRAQNLFPNLLTRPRSAYQEEEKDVLVELPLAI
jgi:hypothetical protein